MNFDDVLSELADINTEDIQANLRNAGSAETLKDCLKNIDSAIEDALALAKLLVELRDEAKRG